MSYTTDEFTLTDTRPQEKILSSHHTCIRFTFASFHLLHRALYNVGKNKAQSSFDEVN